MSVCRLINYFQKIFTLGSVFNAFVTCAILIMPYVILCKLQSTSSFGGL